MMWRTRGRERQAYNFSYDYLDRLRSAVYADVNDAGTVTINSRFNESLTYADHRGNILNLKRVGGKINGACWDFAQIDNLTYTYTTGTNKISSIADAAAAVWKTKGFNPGGGAGNYAYDVNGNMTTDPYKAMTIAYNHLNLPKLMTFTGGAQSNTIDILYDAAGTKLRKTVKTGTTTNYTQDYISGIEYRDGVREAIYTAEGRVKYTSPTVTRYEYSIKDHLGNARISFTDLNGNGVVDETNNVNTNEVLQENHYYPFGLNTDGPWMNDATLDNKYQYNGKEWNDDFGLNLNDYGARWLDVARVVWFNVDPLADEFSSWSPYNYGMNNPVKMIDPDGRAADWFPEYDKKTGKVNLVAEAGDNKASLAKWGNGALSETEVSNLYSSLKDGKIDMTGTIVGDVAKGFEAEAAGCEFNCFSTVESVLSGDDKSTGYGPSSQRQFKEFVSGSGLKESPANDKTLGEAQPFNSAFGYTKPGEPGVIDHVSINAGKDSKGNTWVLTKDGDAGKLQFQKGNNYYEIKQPDKVYQEKQQK